MDYDVTRAGTIHPKAAATAESAQRLLERLTPDALAAAGYDDGAGDDDDE